jgi:serine phosphatase RsbU (regulator of sigma subunit)
MMVQTAVRSTIETLSAKGHAPSPAQVLALVNGAIRANVEKIGADQYMTINALCLREGVVRHAGLHQDILVYREATGALETFETQGIWLGVVDDATPLLQDTTLHLAAGDVVLLTTDGLVEGRLKGTKEVYGPDRLASTFLEAAKAKLPVQTIREKLFAELALLDVADDVTVLVARRTVDAT